MRPLIEHHGARIRTFAERHGVRDIRVFGSIARDDAGDASDIDLLVSLPPGRTGLALGGVPMDLRDHLQPRVEEVTERGLRPALPDRVPREMQRL